MAVSPKAQNQVTVGVTEATVDVIEAARVAVDAPDDAIVSTSGMFNPEVTTSDFPVSITFMWVVSL